MVLRYTRNKYATTSELEDGSLLVRATLEDSFFAVEMEVKALILRASKNGKSDRRGNDCISL